jgi:hypothetical protein
VTQSTSRIRAFLMHVHSYDLSEEGRAKYDAALDALIALEKSVEFMPNGRRTLTVEKKAGKVVTQLRMVG